MTFERAANILCESLDVREKGGVVFYDTTSRLRQATDTASPDNAAEHKAQRPATIVSFSTSEDPFGKVYKSDGIKSFNPIDENLLHSLLAKYRRGKLWSFDEDGCLSSSEEDIVSPRARTESEARRQSRAFRKQTEAVLLQKHFPGVRQLVFSGLWDAGYVWRNPAAWLSCFPTLTLNRPDPRDGLPVASAGQPLADKFFPARQS